MKNFQLIIITPNGRIFSDQVAAVRAPGVKGSFGIMANHAPLISALNRGVLKITQQAIDKFFAINAGLLEVDQNGRVLVLTDDALFSSGMLEARQMTLKFEGE